MSKMNLVFSPESQTDLKEIYQYGSLNWGERKAKYYLDDIKEHLDTILEQPFVGVERPLLLPDLRCLPIESHLIYYRFKSENLEVVRILLKRQDPQRHLF
ncbi:type II toxin-antitoxin system RelE/ParE family toxin [Shewanella sp. 202IG2-18]|uniref:type II toxin-antitoxin system RelE/ParE family toxin n=1 Tax=Parashewanella hymeniacidonis TaxID=2807618 RepID=UPI0019609B10|nr:type II toxin-antitoxin system RelE/ParE family toxin [Parashewanella hymeniacidonis]MBM7073569.1 type II toxin-antitoxin system RelE/ParE family toxin [Parashewanella hymeniacidonis]